jgi:hypothetical protein
VNRVSLFPYSVPVLYNSVLLSPLLYSILLSIRYSCPFIDILSEKKREGERKKIHPDQEGSTYRYTSLCTGRRKKMGKEEEEE